MVELKTLSKEAIPSALQKAKQYRLLNEPQEARSICMDILAVEPDNQDALITLLLALTDSFSESVNPAFTQAKEVILQLDTSYCKAYYSGIIYERRAKAHLRKGGPGAGQVAYDWLTKALSAYKNAIEGCDPDNQDAVLRWNSCARMMNENPDVKQVVDDAGPLILDAFEI
jgi:hypothetical protein